MNQEARKGIESYYAELYRRAKCRVEYFQERLAQDDTYSRLTASLRELVSKIVRAKAFNLPERVQILSEEIRLIKDARERRMVALNIFESDLIPQWQCNKCNDTGFLPNGHLCSCYPKQSKAKN